MDFTTLTKLIGGSIGLGVLIYVLDWYRQAVSNKIKVESQERKDEIQGELQSGEQKIASTSLGRLVDLANERLRKRRKTDPSDNQ